MPFKIIRNDITKINADAIVNAANNHLLAGGGVCGAIFAAAGADKLQKACRKIGYVKTGEAVITKGFNLAAKYIIHTAGPVWNGGGENEEQLLYSCYQNCLKLAKNKRLKSIAFPVISSGTYGYPKAEAIAAAVRSIGDFLVQNEMDVTLVVFDKEAFALSEYLYKGIQAYIADNYVDEHYYKRPHGAWEGESCDLDGTVLLLSENEQSFSDTMIDDKQFEKYTVGAADNRKKDTDKTTQSMPMQNVTAPEFLSAPKSLHREPESPQLSSEEIRQINESLYRTQEMFPSEIVAALQNLDESFSQCLFRMIDERGMTDVETYKRANIDRKLFSKIRKDKGYRPKKTTAVAFAIALELSLAETNALLEKAGYVLSHSSKFDVIIEYFILHGHYNIMEINAALFAFDQMLIGG